jgi:hypothetical protein
MFMSILLSEVQVSITSPNCRNYTDLVEELRAAEKLKRTLWGKDLNAVLKKTSGGAFRYVPKEIVKPLEMNVIGYSEDGLLI